MWFMFLLLWSLSGVSEAFPASSPPPRRISATEINWGVSEHSILAQAELTAPSSSGAEFGEPSTQPEHPEASLNVNTRKTHQINSCALQFNCKAVMVTCWNSCLMKRFTKTTQTPANGNSDVSHELRINSSRQFDGNTFIPSPKTCLHNQLFRQQFTQWNIQFSLHNWTIKFHSSCRAFRRP